MMMKQFNWVGSERNFVDKPTINNVGPITVGRFGGNSSSGSNKNEDGCLVWVDEENDWEFAMILDAHYSAESAELVIETFTNKKAEIVDVLVPAVKKDFNKVLEHKILHIFQGEECLQACREVKGETACLIVVRKAQFVWWFSIGDCLLYLHHPELATLGQYQLNQRHFYEWVGQVNTFELDVPCYSTGTRELRKGSNHLFLTTDGLVECPGDPFSTPDKIFHSGTELSCEYMVHSLFHTIQDHHVRDSTTILTWKIDVSKEGCIPSDLK